MPEHTDRTPSAAYPRSLQGLICRWRGHTRPVKRWFDLTRNWSHCVRCGASVEPIIDYSGHP